MNPLVTRTNSGVRYFKDDTDQEYHRLDGPAALRKCNGHIYWCWHLNDKPHRDDKPACLEMGGLNWYRHGELHRTDGPATIEHNGKVVYAINGVRMSLQEFKRHHLFVHLFDYKEPTIDSIIDEYNKWRDVDYSHEFAK